MFYDECTKTSVMNKKSKLKRLTENNPLHKVFIKNETSPLNRKENDRLYNKMIKLKEGDKDNEGLYKLVKGKLMRGDNIIDQFNINNSIF